MAVSYFRVKRLREQAEEATKEYLTGFGWRPCEHGHDHWFRFLEGFNDTVQVPAVDAVELTRNILDRNVGTE